jgi:EAL and modified HD-GYP domain-containing signal transduction protein
MSKEFFLGRQPILDRDGEIFAYEILFREPGAVQANVLDNNAATSRVLVNTLQNIGLEPILGDKSGFINADETIILGGTIELLPKDNLVIEILETTKVDDLLINRVREYRELGYHFALDDLVFDDEYYLVFHKLFDLVDYIKVDYMFCDKSKLPRNMARFKKLNVKTLAEKVETNEDYEFCKEIGFDLFQGYYFSKPVIISEKSIDPSKTAVVQLINLLKQDADVSKLEKVMKSYPDLYINLLKFMNSSAFFTRGNITSVKHAIAMLGRENLSKWLYLILYAGPNSDKFDNPLLMTAQVRAKLMESICSRSSEVRGKSESGYLVGLISLLDAVFNRDLKEVVKQFNIGNEIKNAVVFKEGVLGFVLKTVEYYEKDDINNLTENFERLGLTFLDFQEIAIESFSWAEKLVGE